MNHPLSADPGSPLDGKLHLAAAPPAPGPDTTLNAGGFIAKCDLRVPQPDTLGRVTNLSGYEYHRAVAAVSQADGCGDVSERRCGHCGRLGHSSPKHETWCVLAARNCPGCVYAGADHIAACPVGAQLKLPEDGCCAGVDMPGVGKLHAHDCPNRTRPVLRASSEYRPISLAPEEAALAAVRERRTNGEERDRLLGQLVFAARDLAESRLADTVTGWDWKQCLACGVRVGGYAAQPHRPGCLAGRVLAVIAQLAATVGDPNEKKEAAADGETGGAGDGIRPRVPETLAAWLEMLAPVMTSTVVLDEFKQQWDAWMVDGEAWDDFRERFLANPPRAARSLAESAWRAGAAWQREQAQTVPHATGGAQ